MAAECRFRNYLKDMRIELEGSILDIACGPFSLGCIYDDVHGHDNSPGFVRCLKERGISASLADISQLDYPTKSFRYVVTFNPPLRPFRERGDLRSGIKGFLDEMLRIAQDRVIIRSGPIMSLLPSEYESLIEQKGANYVIYRASSHFHGS
ncbi:MAG: class I SAM-dependent methyltransferase [Methanotrichaceae archaeon]|nr:class I SAM-dependent methyltransferase [Methanotrichaceae archaeon]